jgi:thiol-disulfide isomerase/thioredoxin
MPGPADTSRVQLSLEGLGEADYRWRIRPLGGTSTTLEAYRGQVLFIHMWATWCRPCITEMSEFEALRDSLEDEEIVFLLVSPEDPGAVERFRRV